MIRNNMEDKYKEALSYLDSSSLKLNFKKSEELFRDLAEEGYVCAYPYMYFFAIVNANTDEKKKYEELIVKIYGQSIMDQFIVCLTNPNKDEQRWKDAVDRLKQLDVAKYYRIELLYNILHEKKK